MEAHERQLASSITSLIYVTDEDIYRHPGHSDNAMTEILSDLQCR